MLRALVLGCCLLATAAAEAALEPVGRLQFDFELGDVWVHGQTAYLGTYSCGFGVQPVDVSNPADPQPLLRLVSSTNSTYEKMVVMRADTAAFHGDLLAVGLQQCRAGGAHGVELWDVTNPRQPRRLGFFDTGERTRGVHELGLFQRGDQAFALLAVPFSERAGHGGDFRIVEVTDPANPVQIADWGIQKDLDLDPQTVNQGGSPSSYCHSAWANAEGTIAYLSYWDAGVILLDISDPAQPKYLGRTAYRPGEEGNAHSVWPAKEGKVLLVADEDFTPGGATVEILAPAGLRGAPRAVEANLTPLLCGLGDVEAEVAYVGRGCDGDPYVSDPRGRIAAVDAGMCAARQKVLGAQEAGAVAVMQLSTSPGPPLPMGGDAADIRIPGVTVAQPEGNALRSALTAGETVRARLSPDPNQTWGYLRLFDVSDARQPVEISSFATARTRQCPPPDGGVYSIHNPFVVGDTAYLSWYSDGVRVLDISDPADPREIASFVPPDKPDGTKTLNWGVHVEDGLVYLSDMVTGLWVLRER